MQKEMLNGSWTSVFVGVITILLMLTVQSRGETFVSEVWQGYNVIQNFVQQQLFPTVYTHNHCLLFTLYDLQVVYPLRYMFPGPRSHDIELDFANQYHDLAQRSFQPIDLR